MSEEIFNYIIERAKKNGFEIKRHEDDYIVLHSDYAKIALGENDFELWSKELLREPFVRFIIPESLDDLKELFRILKIFEQ